MIVLQKAESVNSLLEFGINKFLWFALQKVFEKSIFEHKITVIPLYQNDGYSLQTKRKVGLYNSSTIFFSSSSEYKQLIAEIIAFVVR